MMEVDDQSAESVLPLKDGVGLPLEKYPGDDACLDFTITVNETDDETSGDDASPPKISLETVNGKDSSVVKENLFSSSSESKFEDNLDDCSKEEHTKTDALKEAIQINGECELPGSSENNIDKKASESNTSIFNTKVEKVSGKNFEIENCTEKVISVDSLKRKPVPSGKKDPAPNLPCNGTVYVKDSTKILLKDKLPGNSQTSRSQLLKQFVSLTPSAAGNVTVAAAGYASGMVPGIPTSTSIVLDARTGTHMPYISPSNTASLLAAPGVRLVLPTSGLPSSLMYMPSTGAFLTSTGTAPMFLSSGTATTSLVNSSASGIIPPVNSRGQPLGNAGAYYLPGNSGMTAGSYRPTVGNLTASFMSPVPEEPTSSCGMIQMIRWEVDNRINIRPKYVKPNPKAELGNLAKWMFDLGSDMAKEYVYHDLVRIQGKRLDEGKLTDKEKSDFSKLQEIDDELHNKIGHLKIKLNKSCKCGFKTESSNILILHEEHAHFDRGFLSCSLCKFQTRQPAVYRFHMETEHNMNGRVESRPSFFECSLCPYETNYANRIDQHKLRCQKQFRPAFNLHPSCQTGPEVNLCLENVFYFVFTRQFLNTITKPSSNMSVTTVISSTSAKELAPRNTTGPRTASNTLKLPSSSVTASTTSVIPSYKFVSKTAPQSQQNFNTNHLLQNHLSSSFPTISSKIGNPSLPPANVPANTPVTPQPNSGFEVCEICGGYVKDRKALRIHFFYAHRIDMPFGVFERTQPPLYCATCFARFWTAQGLQKHIEVHKADTLASSGGAGNGVAGKCISCGHRVPNILMHMRMVHNRELRHYLAALMCIFCGNRFSSKSEVESHMGSHHGVVVKNSSVQSGTNTAKQTQPQASAAARKSVMVPVSPSVKVTTATSTVPPALPLIASVAAPKPSTAGGTKMNKGSQCVLCNLNFARNVDLTRHCMRVHHTCMKCGLVVVDKESLNRHTCLHSAAGMRSCPICNETGFHPAYYIKHMRDRHLRRCTVKLWRLDQSVVDSYKRPITISDSEEENFAEEFVSSRPGPLTSKRRRLGKSTAVDKVDEGSEQKTKASDDENEKDEKKRKLEKQDDKESSATKKLRRDSKTNDIIELD